MTYYSRIALGMQCFSGPMAELEGAIRRDRRPLPVLEIAGATYRQWAAAVLRAEMKQAIAELELRLSKQIMELGQRIDRLEEARGLVRP